MLGSPLHASSPRPANHQCQLGRIENVLRRWGAEAASQRCNGIRASGRPGRIGRREGRAAGTASGGGEWAADIRSRGLPAESAPCGSPGLRRLGGFRLTRLHEGVPGHSRYGAGRQVKAFFLLTVALESKKTSCVAHFRIAWACS